MKLYMIYINHRYSFQIVIKPSDCNSGSQAGDAHQHLACLLWDEACEAAALRGCQSEQRPVIVDEAEALVLCSCCSHWRIEPGQLLS